MPDLGTGLAGHGHRPVWKLWYSGGVTFSNLDGTWADAPWRDVQALVVADAEVGRVVEEGSQGRIQGYGWWPGAPVPWGLDIYGIADLLLETGRMTVDQSIAGLPVRTFRDAGIKLGRSLHRDDWLEVFQQAVSDPEFPTKSARLPRERPA